MYSVQKRPDRLSRDTSVSSDTSGVSDLSVGSEAPLLHLKTTVTPQTPRLKCLYILVVVSLIISAISLVVCALLFTGVLQPLNVTHQEPSICLPCQTLVSTAFPEKNDTIHLLDRSFDKKTMICCARTPQQMSILFEKLLKRKAKERDVMNAQLREPYELHTTLPRRSNTTGAHLLVAPSIRRAEGSGHHIRGWMSDHSLAFLKGVTLMEDRLVIKQSGLYLVYSQMYFKARMSKTYGMLGHKVHRYSVTIPNDGKETLLQSAHSCCQDVTKQGGPYIHTSHVAGVFHLTSRDEIYVTVSHPHLIYGDPTRSYLGLYKLN